MMNNTYLVHHGIQGQKWGVRRYQNPDGTLTEEGKNRYKKVYKNTRKIGKVAATATIVGIAKNPSILYNTTKAIGSALIGGTVTTGGGLIAMLTSPAATISASIILAGSLFAEKYSKKTLKENNKLEKIIGKY